MGRNGAANYLVRKTAIPGTGEDIPPSCCRDATDRKSMVAPLVSSLEEGETQLSRDASSVGWRELGGYGVGNGGSIGRSGGAPASS